jgi:rhomboid family GlyGly-CTERM serine protease
MMDCDGARRPGSGIGDSRARLWALLASLVLLAALQAGGAPWRDALRFERSAVLAGEAWRLLTAHLVHFDLRHLAYNAAGLVLLWRLFAREWRPRQWLAIVVAAMAAVDAGLWWQRPVVEWYLGASGVLHGLWAAGAWQRWRSEHGWGAVPLLALAAKLVVEQARGGSLVAGDLPVLLSSHLYGTLGGLLAAVALRMIGARDARPL